MTEKYNKNILECTCHFVNSKDIKNSIDMVLSLNGIPVVAIDLKNQFTGQDVTGLKGEKTFFMPFNQGCSGAGNPQREDGEYVDFEEEK